MRFVLLTVVTLGLVGSFIWFASGFTHIGVPPDPNVAVRDRIIPPEVLQNILKGDSDALLNRVPRDTFGRPDDKVFKKYMAEAAGRLLETVKIEHIPPSQAWLYGQIYITAERWKDAKKAEEIAVAAAKNEDRRVNDSLKLARVLAELNDVPAAINAARSTFNTANTDAAPILVATLLDIVPAAQGKGHDAELAKLLEDAIACEARTIVDPKSTPGQDFLMARPHHIDNAWNKIVELYDAAGKGTEAEAARQKAIAMERSQARA